VAAAGMDGGRQWIDERAEPRHHRHYGEIQLASRCVKPAAAAIAPDRAGSSTRIPIGMTLATRNLMDFAAQCREITAARNHLAGADKIELHLCPRSAIVRLKRAGSGRPLDATITRRNCDCRAGPKTRPAQRAGCGKPSESASEIRSLASSHDDDEARKLPVRTSTCR